MTVLAAPGVVGILLAAGRGERFGGDKLLARLGSQPSRAISSVYCPKARSTTSIRVGSVSFFPKSHAFFQSANALDQ
jgi:hypothetical protein